MCSTRPRTKSSGTWATRHTSTRCSLGGAAACTPSGSRAASQVGATAAIQPTAPCTWPLDPTTLLLGLKLFLPSLRAGFTKRAESPYDPFGAGHSSTSISAALGMAVGRDVKGRKNNVVAVRGFGTACSAPNMVVLLGVLLGAGLLVCLPESQLGKQLQGQVKGHPSWSRRSLATAQSQAAWPTRP